MAVDVTNSPYSLPPPGTPSQDGLGYSRHYAKKIRDMGNTSKDSWIKRIWTHMFSRNKKGEEGSEKEDNTQNKGSQERAGKSVTFKDPSVEDVENNPNTDRVPPENNSSDSGMQSLTLPPVRQNTVRTVSRDSQSQSKSAPPHSRSQDKKILPAELANSPYLPPKERFSYKFVGIDKHHAARTAVQERLRDKDRNHTSNMSNQANSPKGNPGHSIGNGTNQPQKRPPLFQSRSAPGLYGRRPTHPYLSSHPDTWKAPRLPYDPNQARVEKRAKSLAESAMKSRKIFTCQGPYPVDAFVRFSLRKRGWVEKFGPQVNSDQRRGVASKLACEDDEDFEAICSQDVPAPWEEQHGLYATVSRIVRHYPARFIWGGRNVNNLVLRSEVIVNHFPKARYFSSKVLLTQSLRELPWLISADAHDFFPRCYLLNDDDKEDFIEDFRLTACISLLRWVMQMVVKEDSCQESPSSSREKTGYEEVTHVDKPLKKTGSAFDLEPRISLNEAILDVETQSDKDAEDDGTEPEMDVDPETVIDDVEDNPDNADDIEDCDPDIELAADIDKVCVDPDHPDGGKLRNTQTDGKEESCDSDIPIVVPCFPEVVKIRPEIVKKEKKGGHVPLKAVNMALEQLERFLQSKQHNDLDPPRPKNGMSSDQWTKFLQWFHDISTEGATVPITEAKLREAKEMLKRVKAAWPQYNLDGMRNMWLIKPGDSSKGKGIEFHNSMADIIKYSNNATTQGNYVVMKCIEQPLLIHKCKFDIRQWFLVTDWNPLTVWFYKCSYLRICSHEFSWDTMHEAVHLSNVAVQQNYENGKRSDKLPDNNFLTSDLFQDYLVEMGHPNAWKEIVYPGMKQAIVHTLLATMDISENRRSAFELYGADFMLSEDFSPWLLEINASPGMSPSSLDKAKLCATVIEDTFKVVLDRKENRSADIGRFELAYRETQHAPFKCVDNKMMCEGNRIRRLDLQRYAQLDQKATKVDEAKKQKEHEKQEKENAKLEAGDAGQNGTTSDKDLSGNENEEKSERRFSGTESDSSAESGNNLHIGGSLNKEKSKSTSDLPKKPNNNLNKGGSTSNINKNKSVTNDRITLIKKTYGLGEKKAPMSQKGNKNSQV